MAKHGKRYIGALKQIDRSKLYSPEEAVRLVKELATAKFDETIEMHFRLGVDPRHADQQLRGTVVLPHGLGKEVRILVFAEGEAARIAQEAGADIIADDEIINKINDGWVEFDVALAVPEMMRKIGKLGRVLGRRGLMPSPKSGTLVQPEDLPQAIREARAGRVEFRNDRTANVHVPIGKASFEYQKLYENMVTMLDAIRRNKPSGVKGTYIKRIVITSTMGPGIRIDPVAAMDLRPAE
ncbi:MAG: 50S ribosomal protein L1 [Anaerolineae bacterium]|nr:50S ribosomal protein L1 [Anaerolineae bacterium]